jgi:S1-C subfamily serine protease
MVFDLADVLKILRIVDFKESKSAANQIKAKYPETAENSLKYLLEREANDLKRKKILKIILFSEKSFVDEVFEKNSLKNMNLVMNIFNSIQKSTQEKKDEEIFKEISKNFLDFKSKNSGKDLEYFSKNYKKITQELSNSSNLAISGQSQSRKLEKKSNITILMPKLQEAKITKQEEKIIQDHHKKKSENRKALEENIKKISGDLNSEKLIDKSVEKYANDLIDAYKEFVEWKPGKREINNETAVTELNQIINDRVDYDKNGKIITFHEANLESIFQSLINRSHEFSKDLIDDRDKTFAKNLKSEKIELEKKQKEDFENKFSMRKFQYFSKNNNKNLSIQKINDSEKNSPDARRIYELIAKTQKIENEPGVISKMSKETDYLEKLLYALKAYKKKPDLTIRDLKNFIDFSNDSIETTRALINFYDSNEKIKSRMIQDGLDPENEADRKKVLKKDGAGIDQMTYAGIEKGRGYLEKFAFSAPKNPEKKDEELFAKNDQNFKELSDSGLLEIAQKIKEFSANITISHKKNREESMSAHGSAIIYKIDKKNNIVYFLTNEHVLNVIDENSPNKKKLQINNVKIQTMNSDLSRPEYNAEIVGFSPDQKYVDIGLIAVKFSNEDISKIKEPLINEKKLSEKQNVILAGNSFATGSEDFSTNITFGKTQKSIDHYIEYNNPSFSGNSGSGLWNEKGELVGIHARGSEDEQKNLPNQRNKGLAIPISITKKIADNLISEYEKKNKNLSSVLSIN